MKNRQIKVRLFFAIAISLGVLFAVLFFVVKVRFFPQKEADPVFDEQRAYHDIEYQISLGPRTIGSDAHANAITYIQDQLQPKGWKVEIQELNIGGKPIQNVIAKRGKGSPWIILGAHFDTRFYSDQDPDPAKRQQPVPGANDGASGVAVLLEIGRILPSRLEKQVWLVFFDAEDNGDLMGWEWIMGSKAFVSSLSGKPDAAVIVDMIGDANLDIYIEANSNQSLKAQIWKQAGDLGFQQFIPKVKYSMIDDHTPFLQAGIPAVDIIDFDYPYWHTTSDTLDKVSAASLGAVGETVLDWLLQYSK
jgi:glutaminyl-peptide cyclotransferase